MTRTIYLDGTPTIKDPDSTLDYPLDFGRVLDATGDGTGELTDVTVTVYLADQETEADDPADLAVQSGSDVVSPGAGERVQYALVTLTGGVPGVTYAVRYRVTMSGGFGDDRTQWFKIRQR